MEVGFTNTCTIFIKNDNSNPAHGGVYTIKHYVIKFVSDLWQVGGVPPQ